MPNFNMKIFPFPQGSKEWFDLRESIEVDFTASEAPFIMGVSPHGTRAEWLRMKATGGRREFGEWVQKNILDKGHEIEAATRPLVEEEVGEDLCPVTGVAQIDGLNLLASFDGLSLDRSVAWECKSRNKQKQADVDMGFVPECDKWQLVFQELVSGANRVVYTLSDGESHESITHQATQSDIASLLSALHVAKEELQNYTAQEVPIDAVGESQAHLPAPIVTIRGELAVTGNLPAFGQALSVYIGGLNLDPKTDQDFANLEEAGKRLAESEKVLDHAAKNATAQVSSIEEVLRAIGDYKEQARQMRLRITKIVKQEKENRRNAIQREAVESVRDYWSEEGADVENLLPKPIDVTGRVANAMKGRKLLSACQEKAADEVAKIKAEIHASKVSVRSALNQMAEIPGEYLSLFPDRAQLVSLPPAQLAEAINGRIAAAQLAEAERVERIRAEERAKAEAAAREEIERERAKAEAERRAQAAEERARAEAERVVEVDTQQPHPKSFKRLVQAEESAPTYSPEPTPVSPSAAAASAMLSAVYMSAVTATQIVKAIEEGRIPGIKATYL